MTEECFNTSHVVVYQIIPMLFLFCIGSFNTSHVVVYLCDCAVELYSEIGFNTSHVVVYRDFVLHKGLQKRVSIHLML